MTLGEKIKELRTERKLSMRELAKKAGDISASFISDIENGKSNPSMDKIKLSSVDYCVLCSRLINSKIN